VGVDNESAVYLTEVRIQPEIKWGYLRGETEKNRRLKASTSLQAGHLPLRND